MSGEGRRFMMHRLAANEIDAETTASLVNRAFRRHPVMDIDRTSPSYLLEEGGDHAEFIQVRDADGRLAATAMLNPGAVSDFEGSRAKLDLDRALYYGLAAVEDGYTGAGLAFEMMREAECIARARGLEMVILGTLREYGLVPYYERMGFVNQHVDFFEAGHWGMNYEHHHHEMARQIETTVRPATASDVLRVTEVINAAYRAEDFFIDGNRTDEIEVADLVAEGAILVLERGGGIIGAAYQPAFDGESYFGMLSVDPKLQQAGLGKLLVDVLERRAIDAGCAESTLTVVNLREELIPWYRRLGYVADGTAPFPDPWKLKRPAHMVTMRKRLRSGREGREFWR